MRKRDEMLEPYEGKLSRAVLERESGSDPANLAGDRLNFVIVTTDVNDSVREVHRRMPLVLTREQIALWLTESDSARELLRLIPPPPKRVSADEQMNLWWTGSSSFSVFR